MNTDPSISSHDTLNVEFKLSLAAFCFFFLGHFWVLSCRSCHNQTRRQRSNLHRVL